MLKKILLAMLVVTTLMTTGCGGEEAEAVDGESAVVTEEDGGDDEESGDEQISNSYNAPAVTQTSTSSGDSDDGQDSDDGKDSDDSSNNGETGDGGETAGTTYAPGTTVTHTTTTTVVTPDGETVETVETTDYLVDENGEMVLVETPEDTGPVVTRDSCPIYYNGQEVTLKPNGQVGDLTVTSYIPYFSDPSGRVASGIKAKFSGSITLSGTIYPDNETNSGYLFLVDDASKALIPRFNLESEYSDDDLVIFALLFPSGVASPYLDSHQQQSATITISEYELIATQLAMPSFGLVSLINSLGAIQPYVALY